MLQDGDRFWRMPESYIRGNTIKYLRVPDEVSMQLDDEHAITTETVTHDSCKCFTVV